MTTNYPGALDTTAELKNNATDVTITSLTHPGAHNNVSDALLAIETELGANPSGSFTDVVTRLANIVETTPSANQTITSQGASVVPLILKVGSSQTTARLIDLQNSNGATIGFWNRDGELSGSSLRKNNVLLASTDLADSSSILRNPSPSITSPTISSPTLTGTPTAPTAAIDTNTTQVATTAFVKNQGYITPNSPALTGTPTAPTPPVGDNDTSIATTAFVIAEISNRATAAIPVGMISPYGNATPPSGWLVCDGSAVSRSTYSDLFNVISTTYGSGDGSTTFNLPDLRGRIPVSIGTHVDVDALNDNDGVAVESRRPKHDHTVALSTTSLSGHSHSLSPGTSTDGSHSHTGTTSGSTNVASGADFTAASSSSVSTSSAGGHSHTASTSAAGAHTHAISGSVGVSGMTDSPGYVTMQFIIKASAS
jgi:microcystin-dependent protein